MKLLKSLQEVSLAMQAQPGLIDINVQTGYSKIDEELFRDHFEHLLCLGFCFPKVFHIDTYSLHLYSYISESNREVSIEISSSHPRALFNWVVERIKEKGIENVH